MLISLTGFVILLLIAFVGFPLGFSMMLVGFVGLVVVRGLDPALESVSQQILSLALNANFVTLPLFILMGVFVFRAALAEDIYEAAQAWLGNKRGGVAMATVAACGGFASISGSSVATAATMAKVSIPPMRKYKYNEGFAAGTVAAGGTMGILIPPSAALIVYGILTEESIGDLFIAGIVPGILTVFLYILVIWLVAKFKPGMAPRADKASWNIRWRTLSKVWAVVALFFLIIGGISFGVFTPTEGGGIGAFGALIFALARKKMSWKIFFFSLAEAAETSAMIFTIAFGALILNNFVNIAEMPNAIIDFIKTLSISPINVILVILLIYILLGTIIEGLAMIFLTVPIFVPLVDAMGFNLIWFGIVMVMVVEISLITPPIGLNVFVIKSIMPDVPLASIFKGIAPFFIADIARLALVVFFPAVALWLPGLLS
ncbi:MAG: TRAP transporter large permease subunit [Pseudomonadota bacterium]|nr:TRAP transporter large permease subunit [Pseudomonadota bacterium]